MCRMPEVQTQIDFLCMFFVGYCASVTVCWPQCCHFFFFFKSDFLQHFSFFAFFPLSSLSSCVFSTVFFLLLFDAHLLPFFCCFFVVFKSASDSVLDQIIVFLTHYFNADFQCGPVYSDCAAGRVTRCV